MLVLLPVGEGSDLESTPSSAMRNTEVTGRAMLDEQHLAPRAGSHALSLSLCLSLSLSLFRYRHKCEFMNLTAAQNMSFRFE